jgi:hypothetical protein
MTKVFLAKKGGYLAKKEALEQNSHAFAPCFFVVFSEYLFFLFDATGFAEWTVAAAATSPGYLPSALAVFYKVTGLGGF